MWASESVEGQGQSSCWTVGEGLRSFVLWSQGLCDKDLSSLSQNFPYSHTLIGWQMDGFGATTLGIEYKMACFVLDTGMLDVVSHAFGVTCCVSLTMHLR